MPDSDCTMRRNSTMRARRRQDRSRSCPRHASQLRVVAPVEAVHAAHLLRRGLLLVGVRRVLRQGRPRHVLCPVHCREVERRQQVHVREFGLRERAQVLRAVGSVGEGEVGAVRRGHGRVGDREVAHVQLVHDRVLEASSAGFFVCFQPVGIVVGSSRSTNSERSPLRARPREYGSVAVTVPTQGRRREHRDFNQVILCPSTRACPARRTSTTRAPCPPSRPAAAGAGRRTRAAAPSARSAPTGASVGVPFVHVTPSAPRQRHTSSSTPGICGLVASPLPSGSAPRPRPGCAAMTASAPGRGSTTRIV